jgi:hypothetical protein
LALWDSSARTVTCTPCAEREDADRPSRSRQRDSPPLQRGTAGASAEREYQRRQSAHEARAAKTWGRLAGVYLTLAQEPQSTRAWARGSAGEKLLGAALEQLHDERRVIVLHDRRVPGTRTNIDHVAITSTGRVWAIDAKNYQGKVEKRGWFSAGERLYVGDRDCTKLVVAMDKQSAALRSALGDASIREFDVKTRAAICFVNAEWSLFAKPFVIGGVWVGWAKALGEKLTAPGDLEPAHLVVLAERVARALPSA